MDVKTDDALHLKVLRSPHAHARVLHIGREAALAVPGVVGVNLSGSASGGTAEEGARVKAEIAERVTGA